MLTWEAPLKNEDGTPASVQSYSVYRRCATSAVGMIASVQAPALTYTDTHADDGAQCWYSLTALDATGSSKKTNEVTKTFALPSAMKPNGVVAAFTWTNSTTPPQSFAAGFNFRATAAFVTDPPGTQPVLGVVYPKTANGATFGWTVGPTGGTRNRSAGIDARLAGVNGTDVSSASTFRVDLPAAGSATIRLAVGDANFGQAPFTLTLKDGTTTFATYSVAQMAAAQFIDATGVKRTSPQDWVTNNKPLVRAFTTTQFFVTITTTTTGVSIAHLQVTSP